MRSDQTDPETLLPLTPAVFNILLALADGERHGYSIMQEISSQTQGRLRIGPTTLYRSIKHMLEDGLIIESDERPDPALDDERRRYYRLTNLGQRVAAAEIQPPGTDPCRCAQQTSIEQSWPDHSNEGSVIWRRQKLNPRCQKSSPCPCCSIAGCSAWDQHHFAVTMENPRYKIFASVAALPTRSRDHSACCACGRGF